MPFDQTSLDADLKWMHEDYPFTLTFNGSDYTYNLVSNKTAELELMDNQLAKETKRTCAVRLSQFDTPPSRGDIVVIDSETLRVLHTDLMPCGLELRLYLGSQYADRS